MIVVYCCSIPIRGIQLGFSRIRENLRRRRRTRGRLDRDQNLGTNKKQAEATRTATTMLPVLRGSLRRAVPAAARISSTPRVHTARPLAVASLRCFTSKSEAENPHTVDVEVRPEHTPWNPVHDQLGKTPMEMIADVPPIKVQGARVVCNGGDHPALGHPIVYINLDPERPIPCEYCGLRYVQEHHH